MGSQTFLHANNRGVDQLAHMCSLDFALFVCLVISIQAVHVTGTIIIWYSRSVAEMAHLSSAWSLDLITGFSRQGRAFDHE